MTNVGCKGVTDVSVSDVKSVTDVECKGVTDVSVSDV